MPPFATIGPAIARRFGVLSTATPTVYRTTPGDPTHDATQTSVGSRAVWIIRNGMSRAQIAASGGGIYASDWFAVAVLGVDIQAGDVVSDGARAFVLTSAPESDQGFLLAPAEVPAGVPAGVPSDYIPALWFNDARNSGYVGAI